ncbi:four helix bundle protein [Aquirufa sp. OSTEICH-129V]|jgi:four helix bundle protein|uniref:Four helix bundle protein n=1 Tax=Aquirufa avitistagni TaxID=3104728 RepID=A0ABW6DG29_9BACT
MRVSKFEDLLVWQKSIDLAILVYKLFEKNHDWGFKNQIQRASVSIANNIAEGFDRSSDKEFKRFLFIALGSASEVRSMNYLSFKLNYVSAEEYIKCNVSLIEISKMLNGLSRSLNRNEVKYL